MIGDLSATLSSELRNRGLRPPSRKILDSLFAALYYASLRTDEGRRCSVSVVFLDPQRPDPSPPPRIRQDRWKFVRLGEPIAFTDHNIVKVAQASDPRTSSFAVYPDPTGTLRVWGLVDQQNRYHDFVDYHAESGPQRPGVFQVETVGLGHIRVLIGYERVVELKVDRLMGRRLEVFERGPIWNLLRPGILNSLGLVEEDSCKRA